MTKFRLISHHLCPYVQRAAIVLAEKKIPHERTYVDLANKPDWFVRLSPLGRVPVLQTNTAIVFESQVIAEYLNEITPGTLHPHDPLDKARHRSWIEIGSQTLAAIAVFYGAGDAESFEHRRLLLREKFVRVENELSGPLFAGDGFFMIDGVWGTIFRYFDVFDQIADFGVMAGLDKVQTWRKAISQRPSVAQASPAGYSKRLTVFLQNRNSHLSELMRATA